LSEIFSFFTISRWYYGIFWGHREGGFVQSVRTFCEQGEEWVLQMRTSALFSAKHFGFFEVYGVSARTMVRRLSQNGHFSGNGREGQFFAILCWTFFMDGPRKIFCNKVSVKPGLLLKRNYTNQ